MNIAQHLNEAIRIRLLNTIDCVNEYGLLRIFYPELSSKSIMKSLEQIKHVIQTAPCLHDKTVCVNEEGAAGVLCVDCHEQLEKEC